MCIKSEVIVEMIEKGYTVSKEGILYNPKGVKLNGSLWNGYKNITYRKGKKFHTIKIHRLQGYQKFGDKIFEKGMMVRHLDNDSLNNSWDNLAIGNNSQNQMDLPKEIRIKRSSENSKKYDHESIFNDHKKGMTYKQIMQKYRVKSKGTINYIIKKEIRNDLPFIVLELSKS